MNDVRTFALSGAVLAGGQSRRMGQDKALLPLSPGGPALAELALERVRAVADDVSIIAPRRAGYEAFGVEVVPDDFPGAGTLGGIATALRHAGHDRCLVVACDMPFLSERVLQAMAGHPGDWDVLAPRISGESRQGTGLIVQTLHAIYGKGCLAPIESRIAAGDLRVIGFFDQVQVAFIEEEELRLIDPDLRTFYNANTPEALAEARALLAGEGAG
jgi:molybdenum cofactor guanylyltransferase